METTEPREAAWGREREFLRALCADLIRDFDYVRNYELMRRFPAFARLADIPRGAAVAVYGTGKAGRLLLERLRRERDDVRPVFFLDSRHEGALDDLPVRRFDSLAPRALDGIRVLVASAFWREILEGMGPLAWDLDIHLFDPAPTVKFALVLPGIKALFVPVPKSACTSVSSVLMDQAGVSQTLMHKLEQPVDLADPAYADYWKFSFARDPLDRLVSTYSALTGKGRRVQARAIAFLMGETEPGFDVFARFVAGNSDICADVHWRSQHTFFTDPDGNRLVDFLGRFENLDADFAVVRERLGLRQPLPHLYKSQRTGSTMSHYGPELLEAVRTRYARDLEILGRDAVREPA